MEEKNEPEVCKDTAAEAGRVDHVVSCDCSELNRYMTTLEEISKCPVKNFEYWSSRARLNAVGYFNHKRVFGRENGNTILAKAGFLKNMKNRRDQYYYDFAKKKHIYS